MFRTVLLAALVLAACGHDDPAPVPIARVVDAGTPRVAAAAVALPAPHRDPTFRFVKPDATADRAGELSRPTPWIPDAPELEALLPSAPIVALEEEWSRTDVGGLPLLLLSPATHLSHRVQLTVTTSDVGEIGVAMHDGMVALQRRLTARDDAPPVLTFEDPALGSSITVTTGTAAWGDAGANRALFAALDPKADGRTFEFALAVIVPGDDAALIAALARAQPSLERFLSLIAAAGPLTSVSYAREVGRPPRLEVSGLRPVSAAEAAAVRKILDASSVDTIDRDGARIGRVQDPRHAAWSSALVRALQQAGFRKTDEPHSYHLAPDVTFLIIDDTWTLLLGERE